jgi:hypothetical protein
MTEANIREEGYWRRAIDEPSLLPWPIPEPAWLGRDAFLQHLEEAQRTATVIDYMGHSTCRLCGRANGASEFSQSEWAWPEGLRHYIIDHHVRPSADFENFIQRRAD